MSSSFLGLVTRLRFAVERVLERELEDANDDARFGSRRFTGIDDVDLEMAAGDVG